MEISQWSNGTPDEREKVYKADYPNKMMNEFEAILEYSSESGEKIYSKSYYKNGIWKTKKIRKVPTSFTDAKIYYKKL